MQAAKKAPKGADGFFKEGGAKEELSATRKADQKTVDTVLLATIKKTEFLKAYLNARFSLSKGDAPHAMKF
jgi:large subunit ribosomal protein L6e